MHSSYILTIFATVQTVLASSHTLKVRAEERTVCNTPTECKYSYTTGSEQCESGFKRGDLVVKGFPPGSHCKRDCTTNERTACTSKQCKYWEYECIVKPKNDGICASALEWCDGPIAMLKSICLSKKMKRGVTYDEGKHLCIPEGKTAGSRKSLPLQLGFGSTFNANIYDPSVKDSFQSINCYFISYPDAKLLGQNAAQATQGCITTLNENEGNTGYDAFNVRCKSSQNKWKDVEGVIKNACQGFKPFKREGPYFNSLKFSGQPL